MSEYTVTDSKTGKEITFEWNDPKPPTQEDMLAVFIEANKQTKKPTQNPPTDKQIMGTQEPTPEWAGRHPNLYGAYGALRELYDKAGRPAIETAGMVGGGAIGATSGFLGGAGLGAIPGGAVGAGLGYAGARNLTGAIDSALGFNRGTDVTLPKVLKSTGKDLALGAIGGGSPVQSPVKIPASRLTPKASQDVLKQYGIKLSPAEATESSTLAQVESLLEQVPFSSDVVKGWRESEQLKPLMALREKYLEAGLENTPRGEVLGTQIKQAIEKKIAQHETKKTLAANLLRDTSVSRLGSKQSVETLSKSAQEVINENSAKAVSNKNNLYRAIDDAMPQGELPFTNYQKTAQQNLDELSKLPNADSELKSILKWGTDVKQSPEQLKIIESVSKYPPQMQEKILADMGVSKTTEFTKDWATMQQHRNQLNDIIKKHDLAITQGNPNLKGQVDDVGRRAKQLKAALDDDFKSIAENSGSDVLEKWNVANAFYSNEYAPVWKQKTIRDMANKEPSKLIDIAIKPGSTTEVDLARKALGDQQFNQTVKPAFTNKLLGAGRDEPFNPKQLQKALNDYGDETLLKIYTPDELGSLRSIAKTGKLVLDQKLPNASLLKTIASKPDNVIIPSILQAYETNPNSKTVLQNITVVKDLLSKPQQEGLKIELLDRVFRLGAQTRQVEAGTMAKNIDRHKEVLSKFFDKKDIEGLSEISLIGHMMTRAQQMAANPSGTAKNVIAWGMANQLIFNPMDPLLRGDVGEAARRVGYGAVATVIAPRALAKLYVSPRGREIVTKAMMTKSNTAEGRKIAKQISILIGNDLLSDNKEAEEAKPIAPLEGGN